MSYYRVTEPGTSTVDIDDLGITIAQSATVILSDNFAVNDLYLSGDLEALIIASTLSVEIDYGTGWQSVAAGDYTNRDALGAFLNIFEVTNEDNNEDLVDGSEVNTSGPAGAPLHIHDARYYTQAELGDTTDPDSGASLIGADPTNISGSSSTDVQAILEDLSALIGGATDLDGAYDNDSDGIMHVDTVAKNLNLRSDESGAANNDILITRWDGATSQNFVEADTSADEVILGAVAAGAYSAIDVRVKTDLYVDGNIEFVGTITDTTVTNLDVTNASILLREGAGTGADADLFVERGATGADADLHWNETADRWQAGIVGTLGTIALLEFDEDVSGVWTFTGSGDTEPNFILTEKDDGTPPASNLGAAGEVPISMFENGIMAVYDKSNSRNKWLSVQREYMIFTGRNNPANKDEYARTVGVFTSNQTGNRLIRDSTLIAMSIQTNGAETWTAEVRKNDSVSVLATLAAAAAAGNQAQTYNVDFAAGDEVQAYINSTGSNIDRPVIKLEFAVRF